MKGFPIALAPSWSALDLRVLPMGFQWVNLEEVVYLRLKNFASQKCARLFIGLAFLLLVGKQLN